MRRRNDPMADELAALDELEDEIRRQPKRQGSLLVPVLITCVVMTGAATIAWYSYTAGVKEGSEEAAPLLKPSGPMKVAPANPGGRAIPHREKTVYGVIDGRKSSGPERLLPPPERPMPLPKLGTGDKTLSSQSRSADRTAGDKPGASQPAPGQAVTGGSPASGASAENAPPLPSIVLKQPSEPPVLANPEAAEPSSPKPPSAKLEKPAQTASRTPTKPVAKKPVPAGAFRIQIGSVSTGAQAQKFWQIHQSKHGDLLGPLTMVVQRATIKGRTYYRVQAGPFADRAAAGGLCGKLKLRKVGCLVVAPKK